MRDVYRNLRIAVSSLAVIGLIALCSMPLLQTPSDLHGFLRNIGVGMLGAALVIGFLFRGSLGLSSDRPSPNETPDQRDTRRTWAVVGLFTAFGFLGLLIVSLSSEAGKSWAETGGVFGKLAMYAGGCFGVGALVGFLFGIPRSLQGKGASAGGSAKGNTTGNASGTGKKDSANPAGEAAKAPGGEGAAYATNTNLEEISDWLTKIIVGLGLINLKVLPGKLKAIAWYFAEYGCGPVPESVTLALILYFSTCGFFLAYLMTRLFLTGAFTRADAAANRRADITATAKGAMKEAEQSPHAEQGQDVEPLIEQQIPQAKSIAALAKTLKQPNFVEELEALGKQYESLRASMQPGDERTAKLESVASGIRVYALACYSLLEQFMASDSPGERLIAVLFLEVKPDCKHVNWLAERFSVEKPFIQYHAGVALRIANQKLGAACKAQIRAAAQTAMEKLGDTRTGTDRYKVLKKVMEETA